MPKLVWITDPHLNFVSEAQIRDFMATVRAHQPNAILVGGDIAQAHNLEPILRLMAETVDCPIYFVLGNHDYYGSSIAAVRQSIRTLCGDVPSLVWLNEAGVVRLSDTTALVGHDGWADGRLGDYAASRIRLNDYRLIADLAGLEKMQRLAVLHRLGDEAAAHLQTVLPTALERHRQAIVLTHVPPFRQACWHEGHISGDHWLPHMTCAAAGDALAPIMQQRPDRKATVLCGHTHSAGEAPILQNLHVSTGGAEYGSPAMARVWEVE